MFIETIWVADMPKLFPYATTNRWNFMKRRVFSFDKCKNIRSDLALLGTESYKPFIAVDYVYPEHLQGDGPRRFYDQVILEKPFRLEQLRNIFGWHSLPNIGIANKLDRFGDMIAKSVDSHPIKIRHGDFEKFGWEVTIPPFWHSILVDLALFVGECAIESFNYLDPRWSPPMTRRSPQGFLDYPAIVFDVAADVPDDPLLIALAKEYQKATKRDLENGNWIDIFDKVIKDLDLEYEDFKSAEYSPDSVNRWIDPNNSKPYFYPFITARNFLLAAIGKNVINGSADKESAFTLYSLGDCLRQETLPNWTTFPELPSQKSIIPK